MMPNPWKDKVLAYNRHRKEVHINAAELDVNVYELGKLPPGQLKKVLTHEVIAVLEKYGYVEVSA